MEALTITACPPLRGHGVPQHKKGSRGPQVDDEGLCIGLATRPGAGDHGEVADAICPGSMLAGTCVYLYLRTFPGRQSPSASKAACSGGEPMPQLPLWQQPSARA